MKVLVDSDVLFAGFSATDPNHERAAELLRLMHLKGTRLYVLRLVLFESVTVVSHKIGQRRAVEFYNNLETMDLITVSFDVGMEAKAWQLFLKQTKKGTSFVDCANAVAVEELKLDGILSFDRFYKRIGVKVIG